MEPDKTGLLEFDKVINSVTVVNRELILKRFTKKCKINIYEALCAQEKKMEDAVKQMQSDVERLRSLESHLANTDGSMESVLSDLNRMHDELLRSEIHEEQKLRAAQESWQQIETRYDAIWHQRCQQYEETASVKEVLEIEAQVAREQFARSLQERQLRHLQAAEKAYEDFARRRDWALLVHVASSLLARPARVRELQAVRARVAQLAADARAEREREARRREERSVAVLASVAAVQPLVIDWGPLEEEESQHTPAKVPRYCAPRPPPRYDRPIAASENPNHFMTKNFSITAGTTTSNFERLDYGFWITGSATREKPKSRDVAETSGLPPPRSVGSASAGGMIRVLDDVTLSAADAKALVGTMEVGSMKSVELITSMDVDRAREQHQQGDGAGFGSDGCSMEVTSQPSVTTEARAAPESNMAAPARTVSAGDDVSISVMVPPTQFRDTQAHDLDITGTNLKEMLKADTTLSLDKEGMQCASQEIPMSDPGERPNSSRHSNEELLRKLNSSPTFTYAKKNSDNFVTSKFFAKSATSMEHAESEPAAAAPARSVISHSGRVEAPQPPPPRGFLDPGPYCEPQLSLNLTADSELEDNYDFSSILGMPSQLLSPRTDEAQTTVHSNTDQSESFFGRSRASFNMFGDAAAPAPPTSEPSTIAAAGEPSTSATAGEPGFNFNFQTKKKSGFFSLFN